jgi:hypothetical protein
MAAYVHHTWALGSEQQQPAALSKARLAEQALLPQDAAAGAAGVVCR